MSSTEFLLSHFPSVDQETIEYIVSIAEDDGIDETEKVGMISEYLEGGESDIIKEFLNMHAVQLRESKRNLEIIKANAVAACLDVLRQPTSDEEPSIPVDEDSALKRELLMRYDPDEVVKTPPVGKGKKTAENAFAPPVIDDDEILAGLYGLGANENKLRKARETDEMRERAKQEQEEARAAKVQQKLKQQGSQIKPISRKK